MNENEIAVIEHGNPLDAPTGDFHKALERRGFNRDILIEWVRKSLVRGTDFGTINIGGRESNESLWKPGAEKICGMLGLKAIFPTLPDYERAALDGKEIPNIIIRCHLIDARGAIVADGIGARNVEKDRGDLNKALKMALKSAMIDATLRCAGLSEIFTQDLEDMKPDEPDKIIWRGPDLRKHYSTEIARTWGAKDAAGLYQLWQELDDEQKRDIWHDFNSSQRTEMRKMIEEQQKLSKESA